MCGIAAIVAFDNRQKNENAVRRMMHAIRHRGPDDQGYYESYPISFGFQRLAILDLTQAGHQPMQSADRKNVIVFNGEIFNYLELREELEQYGHVFHSNSDTEVLLSAYSQWGPDCLHHLNGMWAFLIWDENRKVLFGARDRFGVKPLYRYKKDDSWIFCSEIKGILASGYYKGRVNWSVAAEFLYEGIIDNTPETFFFDIEQVPAAHAFTLEIDGSLKQWRYWQIGDTQIEASNPIIAYRDLFEDSVRLRLRSDVPIGVCLSGGLDSSSIACSVARLQGKDDGRFPLSALHAFSYMDPNFDEREYIEDTIRQTGAKLNVFTPTGATVWSRIKNILWHNDEPVHSTAAFVGFDLFGMASQQGIKVILNGQGADECLAGYGSYFQSLHYSFALRRQWSKLWNEIRRFNHYEFDSTFRYSVSLSCLLSRSALRHLKPYQALARWRRKQELTKDKWFTEGFLRNAVPLLDHGDMSLTGVLQQSVQALPLPLFLRVEDRNSMAHSVEARLPFMDYRLVSLAFQLCDEMKIRDGWTKWILREAMKDRIPESVRTRRDKMGFPTSQAAWLRGELGHHLRTVLNSDTAKDSGIYNVRGVIADLDRHMKGIANFSDRLFRVAIFEAWREMFAEYL